MLLSLLCSFVREMSDSLILMLVSYQLRVKTTDGIIILMIKVKVISQKVSYLSQSFWHVMWSCIFQLVNFPPTGLKITQLVGCLFAIMSIQIYKNEARNR